MDGMKKKIEYCESTHEINVKEEYCESTHENNVKEKYWNDFLKPENLIDSIIALLTLFSVILVAFTLLEMKQQRESTYMPEIVLRYDNDCVIEVNLDNSDFSIRYYDKPVFEGSGIRHYGVKISHLYFIVENIGFGSARNIKFEWAEDTISKFAESIEEINYFSGLQVLEDGNLKLIFANEECIFSSCWNVEPVISYVNIVGTESNVQKIDAELLGYLIGLCKIYSLEIPNIELKATYENIYGKEYEANILIKPFYTYEKKNNGWQYLINFEIKIEYQQ